MSSYRVKIYSEEPMKKATSDLAQVIQDIDEHSFHHVLTSPDSLAFLAKLHRKFNPRRLELLRERRQLRQKEIDQRENPTFPF